MKINPQYAMNPELLKITVYPKHLDFEFENQIGSMVHLGDFASVSDVVEDVMKLIGYKQDFLDLKFA